MYAPASLLITLVTTPVPSFVAVTVTPGIRASLESETVPLTVALVDWPNTIADNKRLKKTVAASFRMFIPH